MHDSNSDANVQWVETAVHCRLYDSHGPTGGKRALEKQFIGCAYASKC